MANKEINEVLLGKTVILKDLQSEAVYKIKINKNGLTEKKVLSVESPEILTDIDFQARAPILNGSVKFSISENKIITSDGIRTYISSLYKRKNTMYGVRDIDYKSVNFQIIIEDDIK